MIIYENKNNQVETIKLKQKDSIIFINCKKCHYIIPTKINKIIILDCEDCKFDINNIISSFEIVKCSKLYILIYGTLMTTQIDLVKNSELHYLYSKGFVISCGTDNVLVSTPCRNFVLPFHAFLQQYVTNLETWITKRREECLDPEGFLLLE